MDKYVVSPQVGVPCAHRHNCGPGGDVITDGNYGTVAKWPVLYGDKVINPKVWCPSHKESFTEGQEKWVYNNGWSNISSSLMDTRIWGWIAYRYSLAGLSQWGWAYARNPWKNPDSAFGAGDDFKVYPDPEKKEAVVNSIRWEIMREMIEDYEYLYMLEKKTKDPQVVKDLCSQLVQNLGEYEHNPHNLYKVRHAILEKLGLSNQ